MKVIYTNGHINSIQPYYFMLNGQRYNAAHFNENTVFGWYVAPPTISTTAINVTTTIVDITTTDQADEIWWAVNTPTNFQRYTGVVRLNNRPQAIFAYAKVDGTMSRIVRTPVVADPVLTVDYGSAYGQVIWFNNDSGKPMYWTEDNWTTMNSVSNGGHAALDYTMNVKCQAMWNGIWSNEVTQLCLWDVPEPGIFFDDEVTINQNYNGNTQINIYYRIGNTGEYTLYTSPFEIDNPATVYAYAVEANYPTNVSNVVSMYCNPYYVPFFVKNITNSNETLNIVQEDSGSPTLTIECSDDNRSWYVLGVTSTTAITKTITPGETLFIRCRTSSWSNGGLPNYIRGVSKVGGNTMSLLYGADFTGTETSFPSSGYTNFTRLFYNNTNLVSAKSLLLPATTMDNGCYMEMFRDCTNLVNGPSLLSATSLAPYCYTAMFYNCRNLTTFPVVLPATTVADYCYQLMFAYCYHITSTPELPATTLAEGCYDSMFYLCPRLTTAPTLPATTLATDCYNGMFRSCKLTTAPDLPAATLVSGCYRYMFNNCNYLTSVKCLATSGINNDNLYGWLDGGVGSTGTFYKKAGVNWPTGTNGIPNGWSVVEV